MKKTEDEFEYMGKKYVAVDDNSGECHKCCFFSRIPCFDKPFCTEESRSDKRSVIFVLAGE